MVRPSVAQRRCLTLLLYATECQSTLRAAVKSLKRGSAQHPASVSVSQQPESFCSQCVCCGRWAARCCAAYLAYGCHAAASLRHLCTATVEVCRVPCLCAGSAMQLARYQVRLVGDLLQKDASGDTSKAVWDALHMAVHPQSKLPMPASGPFEA